jgi:hypothetical protein
MAIGQSSNLIAAAFILALLISGNAEYWHAYPIIFVTGTAWALNFVSHRALVGDLFFGRALTNATALDTGLETASVMIGPLLGTVLIRFAEFEEGLRRHCPPNHGRVLVGRYHQSSAKA